MKRIAINGNVVDLSTADAALCARVAVSLYDAAESARSHADSVIFESQAAQLTAFLHDKTPPIQPRKS